MRTALCALIVLFILFVVFVSHAPVPVGSVQTWAGASPPDLQQPFSVGGTINQNVTVSSGGRDVAFPVLATTSSVPTIPQQSGTADGWDAFIAVLSHTNASASTNANTSGSGSSGYLITLGSAAGGTGVIGGAAPTTRSREQQALYEYGNAIGAKIQSFEATHSAMPTTLQDQSEHPDDPAALAALTALANDFTALGHSIAAVAAPQEIADGGTKLADGYASMGATLLAVPNASGDKDRVAAMLAYDAAADGYIRSFVSLAETFGAFNVTFAKTDAGSIFSFPAGL